MIFLIFFLLLRTSWSVLPFVLGGSCERNACDIAAPYCSQTLPGVYRNLGPACAADSSCTDCAEAADGSVLCYCETRPYTRGSTYGQPCSPASECIDGSLCFRPCDTFLYLDYCPPDRCVWDFLLASCSPIVVQSSMPIWTILAPYGALVPSEQERGSLIVMFTPAAVFPVTFRNLESATVGYMLGGSELLSSVVPIEAFFFMLDLNGDGIVSQDEFSTLPSVLNNLSMDISGRRLSVGCEIWCPTTQSCVSACTACSTYLTTAIGGTCTIASVSNCLVLNQLFCPSLAICVSDCSSCVATPFPDVGLCRAEWWTNNTAPICRSFPKSAGETCVSNFDCVDGSRECVNGFCGAVSGKCATDRDCDPLTQFCSQDVSQGQDVWFVPSCVPLGAAGSSCAFDSQCLGLLRCNYGSCVSLFSLPVATGAQDETFCESASIDPRTGTCAKAISSLRLGQACSSDWDCPTTAVGLNGNCVAMNWWESGSCRICGPFPSDFSNDSESLKSWLYQKGVACGNLWTDEECVRETGPTVAQFYYVFKCEEQTLNGGVVKPSNSLCVDDTVVDYCAELELVMKQISLGAAIVTG